MARGGAAREARGREGTYIDDLLYEVGHAALGEDLPLRSLVAEQDVEGRVLVRVSLLVVGAAAREESDRWNRGRPLRGPQQHLLYYFLLLVNLQIVEGVSVSNFAVEGGPHADGHADVVVLVRSFEAPHFRFAASGALWVSRCRIGSLEESLMDVGKAAFKSINF